MSILNRRNAVLCWLAWMAGKRALKRKAKEAVPGTVEGTKRPNKPAIVAALASFLGVPWFWRRKSDEGPETPV